MKKVTISPKILSGTVIPPESKSLAHRSIIAASLARGTSRIKGISSDSFDILATKKAMENLGAKISGNNILEINGAGIFSSGNALIDCNESGSTLRFLIPIVLTNDGMYKFIGRGKLGQRPLDAYYPVFEQDNIYYENNSSNFLDFIVKGSLKGGEYSISGDVSSQFITGLLFALPLLKKDSKLIITTHLESKGYVDLTLSVIEKFGVEIENNDYKEFIIKRNQVYKPRRYTVEPDFSQAAFFLGAAAIGNEVSVKNMNINSSQGDKGIIDCLIKMGAEVYLNEANKTIEIPKSKLTGVEIDGSQIPDIVPILSVVASFAKGTTVIKNIERLRIKESDRIEAMETELNKIGAKIKSGKDYMEIEGVESFTGGVVDSWNDHRITMSLAIASTRCKEPLTITGADSVKKSYPNFFVDFTSLGGIIL